MKTIPREKFLVTRPCVKGKITISFFTMLRGRFPAKPYNVVKGNILSLLDTEHRVTVKLQNSAEIVYATRHPNSISSKIKSGSLVFVCRPFASDPTRDEFEMIGAGIQGDDGQSRFMKFACVHPEKLASPLQEDLCGNCPLFDEPR